MNQIMRLRRMAGDDHEIRDRNNGRRHEIAFVSLIRDNGLLWEAELLPRSYGGDSFFGKFHPAAGAELVSSLPAITKALVRGKVTIGGALKPHRLDKKDLDQVKSIYEKVDGREERYELNLYVTGSDEDNEETPAA
jgi:succinate dehydrogenase / fumarate reductase iron-sulfur subunit